MVNKLLQTLILKRISVKTDQPAGRMLNLEVLVDKVHRILTAPDNLLDLFLLVDNGHSLVLDLYNVMPAVDSNSYGIERI